VVVARLCAPFALGFLAAVAPPIAPAPAGEITLGETGSTLVYPVFRIWVAEYSKTHPGVSITAAATDSGAGVEQAISGKAQIGASDAYMSDAQVRDNPLIINIPMAISAQTVNYNVPDLNGQNLKLDGRTLAGVYSGKIQSWDDPAIAAMNAGVKLPHSPIIPIRRNDASGDTFIFTQYLTFTTPSWEYSPGYGVTVGVACNAKRLNRRRQRRNDRQDSRHALFDRLRGRELSRRCRQGRDRDSGVEKL
jgi:phosphate transport system substrate-binding protein